MEEIQGRLLNVSLLPGSTAHRAYSERAGISVDDLTADQLAAGFPPRPSLNLHNFGGKTIADLVFVNHYLGGSGAWDPADIASIDAALAKAMSDSGLQSVIQQYYNPVISSRMLPSVVLPDAAPARIYKDQVETLAAQIYASGALAGADPGSTVINIMLPRATVLVDGFSPGFTPPPGQQAEHERRQRAVVKIDDDQDADSTTGLAGYHGSTHVTVAEVDPAVYYAVGVYSEGGNGIPVFDQSWKNVVATFYHELNEARTDPDVEDVIRTNDTSKLGWYSNRGGEIGDIPVKEAGTDLTQVFQEVELADGSGTVPIQLMWSSKDDGPARHAGGSDVARITARPPGPVEVRGVGVGDEGGEGDRRPELPMVSRVLRAEFPTLVRTGVSLVLFATISERRGGPGAWSPMRPVAVGSDVMVTCSAPGFELRSDMQVTIAVPAFGDSDPAPFELVATDPGQQTITLRAFAGSSYLGSLSIQVTVDSAGRTGQPAQHAAELSRRQWQHGEVTLEIEYDPDRKLYTYRWRDGTFIPDGSFRNDEQLQRTPVEVVDGIAQELNTLARGMKGYSAGAAEEWLKNQGIGLWQSFFPKRLQAQIRQSWNKITRLSIISKNDMIPWELLYASDEDGELGYLAQHFPIARLPHGGVPASLNLASADFIRPPKDSPAAAAQEVQAVSDILTQSGVEVHAAITDLDSLRALLAAGRFSLLHFASHNSFSQAAPFAKITLGKAAFEPSFLNQYKPRAAFRASSPLVFINACGSDRRAPVYTRLGGWADAFIDAGRAPSSDHCGRSAIRARSNSLPSSTRRWQKIRPWASRSPRRAKSCVRMIRPIPPGSPTPCGGIPRRR